VKLLLGRARALASLLLAVALVSCGAGVPPVLRDELARAPRGAVVVVFFTDLECPFCRRTHAALQAARAARSEQVRVVVHHVPLPMHPDARSAAVAAICGEALGAGEELLDALYRASDLGERSVEALVLARGVDRARYEACVAAPSTADRIARDTWMLDAIGGDGLPLLYVGRARLEGAQTRQALEEAIEAAR
jgi:protein-disulfide isomerase